MTLAKLENAKCSQQYLSTSAVKYRHLQPTLLTSATRVFAPGTHRGNALAPALAVNDAFLLLLFYHPKTEC